MLEEDFLPQKKKPQLRNLDPLSIEELQQYIEEMKIEIVRVEERIKSKQASAEAANLFFKGKS